MPYKPECSGAAIASTADQGPNLATDLRHLNVGNPTLSSGSALAPIQAFDLIGQDGAWALAIQQHFEGVALDLSRHRAADHQASLPVIGGRTQYHSRTVPSLFASRLWTEAEPNDVTSLGNVGASHLPVLFTYRRAKIGFVVEVVARDSLQEGRQAELLVFQRLDHNSPGFLTKLHWIVNVQPDCL